MIFSISNSIRPIERGNFSRNFLRKRLPKKAPAYEKACTESNLSNNFFLLVPTKSSPRKYARLHHPLRGIMQVNLSCPYREYTLRRPHLSRGNCTMHTHARLTQSVAFYLLSGGAGGGPSRYKYLTRYNISETSTLPEPSKSPASGAGPSRYRYFARTPASRMLTLPSPLTSPAEKPIVLTHPINSNCS